MSDSGRFSNVTSRVSHHRRLIMWVLSGGIVLTIVLLAWWWNEARYREHTNNAYIQADSVVIAPKVAGYVTAVDVRDDQVVARAQSLVLIDPAPYRSALDLALSDVAQRRADLIRIQVEREQQHAAIDDANARVAIARANADMAAKDAQRFEQLYRTGAATTQRRDRSGAERDVSEGVLRAAQANARSSLLRLQSNDAEISQVNAALAAAEARVRKARSDFEGVRITSPLAGVIGDRSVRVGQYVQPGTRLMTVVPVGELYIVANFKETQLRRMRVGQPATISIDALGGPDMHGVVVSIAPGTGAQFALLPPENATGNFTKIVQRVPVRIRMLTDDKRRRFLRAGLSAEVGVDTRHMAEE